MAVLVAYTVLALEYTNVQPGQAVNEDPENASKANWKRCHNVARRLTLAVKHRHAGILKSKC